MPDGNSDLVVVEVRVPRVNDQRAPLHVPQAGAMPQSRIRASNEPSSNGIRSAGASRRFAPGTAARVASTNGSEDRLLRRGRAEAPDEPGEQDAGPATDVEIPVAFLERGRVARATDSAERRAIGVYRCSPSSAQPAPAGAPVVEAVGRGGER
jgi:hypothetical protein